LRPLSELITVYHNAVGRNTVMELDFAIDQTGQVEASHAALYKRFGDWIRECYGTPLASAQLNGSAGSYDLEIVIPISTPADRIVLREDQRQGERILSYRVVVVATGAVFSSGTSVGNKRIDLGAANVTGTLRLEVVSTARGLPPFVTFAAYAPCPTH
jgi:alpha-L-fucosidase